MKAIYLDFEYSENCTREAKRLVGCSLRVEGVTTFYDLRTMESQAIFMAALDALGPDILMNCYNLQAELDSLLHLGWYKALELDWIDWWTEAKMFMFTHPNFISRETNLLAACRKFKVKHPYANRKDEIRDIIIGNETYTEEQWKLISEYCIADTEVLPQLAKAIRSQWKEYGITPEQAIRRGKYSKAATLAFFKTKGLPVDTVFLDQIFQNREILAQGLKQHINELVGLQIYQGKKLSFNAKAFEELITKNNLQDKWSRTDTNKMKTADLDFQNALDTFLSDHKALPIFMEIHDTRSTLKAFRSTDLRTLVTSEGYIKPVSFPFHQKSSRTSPKPKLGFLLNLQPWLRSIIHPKPGMVLIAADWGQQEIAIAASLSGDEQYKYAYKTDIYLEAAKLVGVVPKEATKQTHPKERQAFKSIVLGIGYGKQASSLSMDFAVGFNLDDDDARDKAYEFIAEHREAYPDYWDWIDTTLNDARAEGYYTTLDNWKYFVDWQIRDTQLQNLPMQSNAAAMMRQGVIRSVEARLDVVCSLHDAIYINATVEESEMAQQILANCMQEAVRDILGESIVIKNDIKVYSNDKPYVDSRGEATLKKIKDLLDKTTIG